MKNYLTRTNLYFALCIFAVRNCRKLKVIDRQIATIGSRWNEQLTPQRPTWNIIFRLQKTVIFRIARSARSACKIPIFALK